MQTAKLNYMTTYYIIPSLISLTTVDVIYDVC